MTKLEELLLKEGKMLAREINKISDTLGVDKIKLSKTSTLTDVCGMLEDRLTAVPNTVSIPDKIFDGYNSLATKVEDLQSSPTHEELKPEPTPDLEITPEPTPEPTPDLEITPEPTPDLEITFEDLSAPPKPNPTTTLGDLLRMTPDAVLIKHLFAKKVLADHMFSGTGLSNMVNVLVKD